MGRGRVEMDFYTRLRLTHIEYLKEHVVLLEAKNFEYRVFTGESVQQLKDTIFAMDENTPARDIEEAWECLGLPKPHYLPGNYGES
jgi:hypothetical protein